MGSCPSYADHLFCHKKGSTLLIPYNPFHHSAALVVNGRFRAQRITGVQRYAHEIVKRLPNTIQVLTPRLGRGAVGHLWEQTALPLACHGRLLWSPNACGPLNYSNQIVTFHDLFPVENPEWYSTSYAHLYGILMRTLARNAMHVIAVSEFTKSRIVKLFGRDPAEITVIANGSHMTEPASVESVAAAAVALHLPTRRYVLSLSSLETRKNLRGLLQAWKDIYQKLPDDLWLILAGPKASENVYSRQELPSDLPRVLYTGYVPEEHLPGLYTGASLFVCPSLAEGFGLPLLEAMACGRRSISSCTSSLPEVGGDAAFYMDPAVPGDLARAMMHCLLDQPVTTDTYEPSIAQAARFSWDHAAAQTYELLQTAPERISPLSSIAPERTTAS